MLTMRFGENLGIGVIQGEGTLNKLGKIHVLIHEILRYKNKSTSFACGIQ